MPPIEDCDVWESGHVVASTVDEALARDALELMDDPYEFALYAYSWGSGGLSQFPNGPVGWQREVLMEIAHQMKANQFDGLNAARPIRIAVGSGHDVGKSCEIGILSDALRSTRPNSKGIVTANTVPQLETKTWAEIIKWKNRSKFGHWFTHVNLKLYHPRNTENWRLDAQTCKEENSESFAGGHNIESMMYYLLDEASAIPDVVWEVAEGGLLDGEPLIIATGNRTRNQGKFNRIFTTAEGRRWKTWVVDSREFPYSNKREIAEWAQDYGEDSDFFRVRVRGLPPVQDEDSLIATVDVEKAMQVSRIAEVMPYEPLILGVDCGGRTRSGTVLAPRRGHDSRTIPWEVYSDLGEEDHDMQIAARIAEFIQRYGPDATMIDAGNTGSAVIARLRQLGFKNVLAVRFGDVLPKTEPCLNVRAKIWSAMAEWLRGPAMLPINYGSTKKLADRIQSELVAQTYTITAANRRVLTSKQVMARAGLPSPDTGDALACTFAFPVGPRKASRPIVPSMANVRHYASEDGELPAWMTPEE